MSNFNIQLQTKKFKAFYTSFMLGILQQTKIPNSKSKNLKKKKKKKSQKKSESGVLWMLRVRISQDNHRITFQHMDMFW